MSNTNEESINKTYNSNDVYLFDASKQAEFDHKNALEINKRIPFELNREFLIKLLPAQKVEVSKTVKKDRDEKDPETGEILYDVEDVIEEIDNPVVEAIILALPKYPMDGQVLDYVIGEHILVNPRNTQPFYWFKDANIINGFNIIGKIKSWAVQSMDGTEATDEDDTQDVSDMLDATAKEFLYNSIYSKLEDKMKENIDTLSSEYADEIVEALSEEV